MKTRFTSRRIDIVAGEHLWLDGNSKITADNSDYNNPVANAFSLISIDDCPYSTEVCRSSCYTAGLKKHSPATFDKYIHNSKTIRAIVQRGVKSWSWQDSVTRVAAAADQLAGGFRWHVSGDIFSYQYAEWIADVCRRAPYTEFWIYTRSFPFVRPLLTAANLTVNLSADFNNANRAYSVAKMHGLRVCYMNTTHADDSIPGWLRSDDVIFPDYAFRGWDRNVPTDAPWWQSLSQKQRRMVCAPDFFGQSEQHRCGPCRKCIDPSPQRAGRLTVLK